MTAAGRWSYMQIFSRFGLTWHRKVNFSTFSGKLTFQSTRNGPQNLPFCPGPLQDTFILFSSIFHQHIFRKYFSKKTKTDNPKRRAPEFGSKSAQKIIDLVNYGAIWCQIGHLVPFCPGSLQDTFIIFSSISHQHIFRKYVSTKT